MTNLAKLLQLRQKTTAEVANATGIAESRLVGDIEASELSLAELQRVAQFLGVAVADLFQESPEEDRIAVFFRQTVGRRHKGHAHPTDVYARHVARSLEIVADNHLPTWISSLHARDVSGAEALRLAEQFRLLFYHNDQVSPILTLPRIAADDLQILLFLVKDSTIDGASAVVGDEIFVFVSERFPPRMLFTLAHEIGHILLRPNDGRDAFVVDEDYAAERLKPTRDKYEAFADAFASCLLVPAAGVAIALKAIRERFGVDKDAAIGDLEILLLAHLFGVSFQVAARRCEDLDLLPSGGAWALYQHLSAKYGSPEKRAEAANLPERPTIEFPIILPKLVQSAVARIRDGDISVGRAASLLGTTVDRIIAANAPR